MSYTVITKEDMDEKLKSSKGWMITKSGNEYVYDFNLSKKPIVVKVASSIRLDTDRGRNKGDDAIRIFAIEKKSMNKKDYEVKRGLIKSKRVYRTTNWRDNLEKAVIDVIKRANIVYDRYK